MLQRSNSTYLAIGFCLSLAAEAALSQPALSGFSLPSQARQLEIERLFASVPKPESARRHHRILTEEPHVAGQAAQRRVAEYLLEQFRAAGIDADLAEYEVYLPYPRHIALTLLEPEQMELNLREEGIASDKDSFAPDVIFPFHAYSASAAVEAQVVYVNYGLPEDYAYLKKEGIEVRGKIVLARYGRSFRGVKVWVAEENGAAGILIYSDPFDDGYYRGDIYPEGPMRHPSAVQRGSVQYLFVHPGDPLTPGTGARAEAPRLTPEEAKNIPSIPSLPLAYEDARFLLESLAGENVPSGWQGALPFAYHIGPGPTRVRLKVDLDYAIRPIWNVIGRIEGTDYPDQWVILGNHIDAWTYGAVDPHSGTTALLELVQGLGQLLAEGIRPRRTLILAGWDGEEYGLLGSTEWAEDLKVELGQKAVAYLNVDNAVSGDRFSARAVPSLAGLIREVAAQVADPATAGSVLEAWTNQQADSEDESFDKPRVGELGSGSDYTVFLDHLGIPSLTMSFGGKYGVYHSIYDNHQWMSRFGDPAWQYHPTMARLWGRLALRLANAEILPFDYGAYGRSLSRYLQGLQKKASPAGGFAWEPLLSEAESITRIGEETQVAVSELLSQTVEDSKLDRFNELSAGIERLFLLAEGLPGRPWFRHSIFAPGFYTGYSSLPLPGLAQALADEDHELAREQGQLLLGTLRKVRQALDQMRRLAR